MDKDRIEREAAAEPAATGHDGLGGAREAFAALMGGTLVNGRGEPTGVLKVDGAPRSGKTTFAIEAFVKAWKAGLAPTMTVRDRVTADLCNTKVLDAVGVMGRRRPVGTLGALAHALLTRARAAQGLPLPKLLNGAEQESAIRAVLRVHIAHAGQEDCRICGLFHQYFNIDEWAKTLVSPAPRDSRAQMRERLNQGFVSQLRDSFARLSELGIADERHLDKLIGTMDAGMGWAESDLNRRTLVTRFHLVFALRDACDAWVAREYPDEYRLDSSQLLVQTRLELEHAGELPRLVVVDDWQDTTLAGASLLDALGAHGTKLLLVGCNDESVQTFRGAYPEALHLPSLPDPALVELDERFLNGEHCRQVDRVAARVSQNIGSVFEVEKAVPQRPGKLHAGEGINAFAPMPSADAGGHAGAEGETPKKPFKHDDSLDLRVFRSRNDEAQDLLWQVTRRHMEGMDWKDMAVVTHDNGTLRALGERLEREGIPVVYSRVTRPLKEENVVQGLFALIDLAQGVPQRDVRERFVTLLSSPLAGANRYRRIPDGGKGGKPRFALVGGRPIRIKRLDAAFHALATLDRIARSEEAEGRSHAGLDDDLARSLHALSDEPLTIDTLYAALLDEDADKANAVLAAADRVLAGRRSDVRSGRTDETGAETSAQDVEAAADADAVDATEDGEISVRGRGWRNLDVRGLARAVDLIGTVRRRLTALETSDAASVLWEAWDSCKVADRWQHAALEPGMEGRLANQRLDVAMRLFDAASIAEEGVDVAAFMDRIRETDVAADSLAHLGPVEDAITLTTPAGAAGRSWTDVWLPSIQQGGWPNLAPRDTMFGVEDLADLRLRGRLGGWDGIAVHDERLKHDERLMGVLYGELKGFLVALTRATGTTHLSTVWSGDDVPSGFLFDYLPELLRRKDEPDESDFTVVGSRDGDDAPALGGLEVTRRGLVSLARRQLAQDVNRAWNADDGDESQRGATSHISDNGDVADAANALSKLARAGVAEADPANWAFVYGTAGQGEEDVPAELQPVSSVYVSPSGVDAAWACPLQWTLDRRMAGPRPGQVSASFGTLIHKVAQEASKLRYDRLTEDEGLIDPDLSVEENTEVVAGKLRELYDKFAEPAQSTDSVDVRIKRRDNEAKVDAMLGNIAGYFVDSLLKEDYLKPPARKNGRDLPDNVGQLTDVECEREFNATFTMTDLWKAYRRTVEHQDVSEEDFAKALDLLAEGLPEGMDTLNVTLAGRIDRLERRDRSEQSNRDGVEETKIVKETRIIDWKTGDKSGEQCFNDLQLVCYQLGLAFPGKPHKNDGESSPQDSKPVTVARSLLFPVGKYPYPAAYHGPEKAFQPRMFRHVLASEPSDALGFDREYLYRTAGTKKAGVVTGGGIATYFTDPLETPSDNPVLAGLHDENGQRVDNDQLEWCLTMVARVLYAAGYMRKGTTAYPAKFGKKCCGYCAFKDVCPLWPDDSTTVMEVR